MYISPAGQDLLSALTENTYQDIDELEISRPRSLITGLADKLERKGLIETKTSEDSTVYRLTEAGANHVETQ